MTLSDPEFKKMIDEIIDEERHDHEILGKRDYYETLTAEQLVELDDAVSHALREHHYMKLRLDDLRNRLKMKEGANLDLHKMVKEAAEKEMQIRSSVNWMKQNYEQQINDLRKKLMRYSDENEGLKKEVMLLKAQVKR